MVGGDCVVSLVFFDYLSGCYGWDLGVVWLDIYFDIFMIEEFYYFYEMVVSFLLGKGVLGFNVYYFFVSDQVILVGLIEEDLCLMDYNVFDYQV